MKIPSRLDLESQLYAVLKTLQTAHKDMIKGSLSYPSYCTIIRQKINDLMVVEMTFQAKGMELDRILKDMTLKEEFFTLIPQIHEYITLAQQERPLTKTSSISLSESEQILKSENMTVIFGEYSLDPIVLANLASEITASFITIFDFFKLDLDDPQLLQDSFHRMENALRSFPGMSELYLDFKSLIKQMKTEHFSDDKQDLYLTFEKLYRRFLAFLKKPTNL